MSNADEAIAALGELGLTEYEARCFVALARVSKATAREIGQVADVPRSRVYDTVARLDRKGLVEVQQSDPREYKAVSVETACRRLREDYDSRINAAENALGNLETPESPDDEGMWAITQSDHVTDRIGTFLDDAEETIHHVIAEDEVLDQRTLDGLQSAAERGVRVLVEVPAEAVRERVQDAAPDATVVVEADLETTNAIYDERPAQLLMVDQQAVIAAGIKEGGLPGVVQETAMWTYGRDHGFAAWMRELLDDRAAAREYDR